MDLVIRFRAIPPMTMHKLFPRFFCPFLASLAIGLSLFALSACGSSESLTHIEGSSASTSKATLNHWMRAMAGGDFRASTGAKAPDGLVAEPANYSACTAAAKKIVPRSSSGQLKLSDAQISAKCHELYRSIKAQALSFLLSAEWAATEGKEQGIEVSPALLHKEFERYRKDVYPTEADLQSYLAERRWVLSDILYQLKRNILVTGILPKFEAEVNKAGGGEAVYARLSLERYKRLIAKTSCKPGYLAPGCKEYHGPATVKPAPNVILEGFVKARAG